MLFTYRLAYHRAGRIPVLPALAAAGAIAAVGGLAVTILSIVAVAGFGARLLRTFGLAGSERAPASEGGDVIEGVVVNRSSVGRLDR